MLLPSGRLSGGVNCGVEVKGVEGGRRRSVCGDEALLLPSILPPGPPPIQSPGLPGPSSPSLADAIRAVSHLKELVKD